MDHALSLDGEQALCNPLPVSGVQERIPFAYTSCSTKRSLHLPYSLKAPITTNEWGEPDDEEDCIALNEAIKFHTSRLIPNTYKDGLDMPKAFVQNIIDDLEIRFNLRYVAEDYISNRVKAAWSEWISPPSVSCSYERRSPLLDSIASIDSKKIMWRTYISTNEWGEPDDSDDYKALVKAINFHTRRHIPIIYKDAHDLPNAFVQKVLDALEECFVTMDVDDDYLSGLVKAAWKGRKSELRRKYIKDKDPATVKVSSPSPFVTNEDWSQFVDMCNSSEYKAICARNAANRRKKEAPSTPGGPPEIGKERNLNCDAEQTKKQKTVQCPEPMENFTVSSDLEFCRTVVNDALPQSTIQIGRNVASPQLAGPSIQPCQSTIQIGRNVASPQFAGPSIQPCQSTIQIGRNVASPQLAGPSIQPCQTTDTLTRYWQALLSV